MSEQMPFNKVLETETETSELYQQAQKLKPQYANHSEALASIQNELEKMAGSMGLTIELFLQKAETSKTYSEIFLKALSLQSQLRFYKSQIK